MATGDDALAAGMDIVNGATTPANTIDDEINKSRDYIAQFFTTVKTWATGLFLPKTDVVVSDGSATVANKVPRYDGNGRLVAGSPIAANGVATKSYVDGAVGGIDLSNYVAKTGGQVMSGNLFLPNSSAAVSGYTIAYINSDGRVSKGASSERYKKYISAVDPGSLGDIWPQLTRFQMRQGDGSWRYGYIAERLAENPAQEPFVVYMDGGEGVGLIPDSIDFIALLLAQVAQLHQRVTTLEARS